MSSNLTSGRTVPCKNNSGGIKELWIGNYTDVGFITGHRDGLITNYPLTLMFLLEGQNKRLSENLNSEGGYDLSLNVTLTKQDLNTNVFLNLLLKNRIIAVTVDYIGNIKVVGSENGLDVEVTAELAGNKAGFNGYNVTLKGLEQFPSSFLNAFPGSGFEKEDVDFGCLLASSGFLSSIPDKISSCGVASKGGSGYDEGCILASSQLPSSIETLVSTCN